VEQVTHHEEFTRWLHVHHIRPLSAFGDDKSEVNFELANRLDLDKLKESNYLITMGCVITKFNPDQYGVESREWDLTNPDGQNMETVREVRDEIESRVTSLFDEIERFAEDKRVETNSSSGIVGSIRDALSL